jgi:hypothetical protein
LLLLTGLSYQLRPSQNLRMGGTSRIAPHLARNELISVIGPPPPTWPRLPSTSMPSNRRIMQAISASTSDAVGKLPLPVAMITNKSPSASASNTPSTTGAMLPRTPHSTEICCILPRRSRSRGPIPMHAFIALSHSHCCCCCCRSGSSNCHLSSRRGIPRCGKKRVPASPIPENRTICTSGHSHPQTFTSIPHVIGHGMMAET